MSAHSGLSIRGLHKSFQASRGAVLAGVTLQVDPGETVALIGRSGAGKSTLARCLVGLETADSGEVRVDGSIYHPRVRRSRHLVQMVWQDAITSLSPFCTIRQTLREPMDEFGMGAAASRDQRVEELIESVGLQASLLDRRPHQLSGGECQRVGIARALATDPRVLVLDEPLSALDAPGQAEILPVLRAASRKAPRAVLLISHDLTAIRRLATRVAVLHGGRVVEDQATEPFFADPQHPATREFLAAWPPLPFT